MKRETTPRSFPNFNLLRFLILTMLVVGTAIPGSYASSDCSPRDLAALHIVKTRTVEWLRGGETAGERRLAASQALSEQAAKLIEGPYQPIQVEDDPPLTTINTQVRANELRMLAHAYADVHGKYHRNPQVLKRIIEATEDVLGMYHTRAGKEGNWYVWMIAAPNDLGAVALMLEDVLPQDLHKRIISTIASRLDEMVLGGANASWEARNHAYLAMLTEDCDRLAKAAHRVFVDVRYGAAGVREDYSYLFHGRIPYAAAYGSGFVQTVGQFAYLFHGTHWALDDTKADLIAKLVLEHTRWFAASGQLDIHITGRTHERVSRPTGITEGLLFLAHANVGQRTELLQAAKALLLDGATVGADLASWADELLQSDIPSVAARGFRYWPVAEMGAFRTEKFHIGFRQYSNRVQDYEYINRQGGKGWNLAMGATNILLQGGVGSWYEQGGDLAAEVDMESLSSATFRRGSNPDNYATQAFRGFGYSLNFGVSPFAGGAGWGDSGVAGFILIPPYGGIKAHKSLHFFSDGYWALGSGIHASETPPADAGPVVTSILQWRTGTPNPSITLSSGKEVRTNEEPQKLRAVKWLWFANMGVVFEEPTDIYCGSAGDVVQLWLDHGVNPQGEGYAYAVMPGATLKQTRDFATAPSVAPIRRDATAHAVADAGGRDLGVVFFEPGQVGDVAAATPLIFHRNHSGSGEVVTVQNPLQDGSVLQYKLDVQGDITFKDTNVLMTQTETPSRIFTPTIGGRLYRFATGAPEGDVRSFAHEDLEHLNQFKVRAQSTPTETILTVRLPDNWAEQPFRLNIGGRQGHLIKILTEDDIVDVQPGNIIVYRWERELTPEHRKLPTPRQQRSGDFRLHYDTDKEGAVDYFSVPYYNEDGEEVPPPPDHLDDSDSPYRKRV